MKELRDRPIFIRNLVSGELLERFLVSAVASLLAVRFFLAITGFPKLGGGGLHIAHMLWGGGLMLAAQLLLLGYLGDRIRRAAAVVGGIGFGLFIDELGKFITSDNDYFYRPAVAAIYVVFVLLFLWWRSLERRRTWSEETYLANSLMLLQEAALHDLDPTEKYRLTRWLRESGQAGTSLLGDIGERVAARKPDLPAATALSARLRWLRRRIDAGLRSRWTGRIVITLLVVRSLGNVISSVALVVEQGAAAGAGIEAPPVVIAAGLAGLLALIGLVYLMLRSRIRALRWFKRSVLVSILLTDLFTFYYAQFEALADLAIDLIILGVLEVQIDAEHRRSVTPAAVTPAR
jgi:hypothetical protein